jgi:hypothetical protein
MDEQEQNLAYHKERDDMYYRERAVEHALMLLKQNEETGSVVELIHNANVIYSFLKGNLK